MTHRNEIDLGRKLVRAIRSLFQLSRQLILGKITIRQFLLDIRFRLISKKRILNDDFDWEIYPKYYKEELKSISRRNLLVLVPGMYNFVDGKLAPTDKKIKPLHPNHQVLYEAVLRIDPISVLEVGCGGGDHLSNLSVLKPELVTTGYDRAQKQIEAASARHPELKKNLYLRDITMNISNNSQSELVYSQAVLMHISEQDMRFKAALGNMFNLATKYVVLVENWTQHDFLSEIRSLISEETEWNGSKIYFLKSQSERDSSALIISKLPLVGFEELQDYGVLLGNRALEVH